MSYHPGVQLKIQKRQQQGRGEHPEKRYVQCPNCGKYYVRTMYILNWNRGKQKWFGIGKYCEGCGMAWTYRRKEIEEQSGIDISDYPLQPSFVETFTNQA
jgi:hypothetical protein